ncbi:glutaminyl-peptide cyclotransferase-like protein isoform X1 [Amphibalanus amphitrite]|nr:glutaminyl-peptide cyclotransferase-like protein isoform X1 [Amphibalanus amphitrite]
MDPDGASFNSLLAPMLRPRYVTSAAHTEVRQHIVSTLESLGWAVDGNRTFEMRTPRGPMDFTNVIATHDPAAPRRLVLACHYDSIFGRDTFIGATDSAVPCAMMLHLATLMTKRYLDPIKGRSELTLQLLFLDGEEAIVHWTDTDSIYGARHLASELERTVYQRAGDTVITELQRMDLFVLLDLLGTQSPTIYNYPYCADAEFRQLAAVERRLKKLRLLDGAPRMFKVRKSWSSPVGIEDDHLPFMHRGVKILHVIPVPFPAVWHEDSDDASVIHRPSVTSLGRSLRVWVAEYLQLAALLDEDTAKDAVREEL